MRLLFVSRGLSPFRSPTPGARRDFVDAFCRRPRSEFVIFSIVRAFRPPQSIRFGLTNPHISLPIMAISLCLLRVIQVSRCGTCVAPAFFAGTTAQSAPAIRISCAKEITKHEEESEGLLVNRVADRRRDYFDHRGHRNSEPASRPHRGQ